MAKEIERKFLVVNDEYKAMACGSVELRQGYVCRRPGGTVRVRTSGIRAWLTVKGCNSGCVRDEWEYEIPRADAEEILAACTEGTVVSKRRYFIPVGDEGLRWEVDEFSGTHSGLVVAEIELPDADTPITLPPFIGREVTGDVRYYNSSLAAPGSPTPPRS